MSSLVATLGVDDLAARTKPFDLRAGRAIVSEGGVKITLLEPARAKAIVGGVASAGQRRSVELSADAGMLRWSCTCTKRKDHFCKHCVAAAVAVIELG